MHLDKHKKFSTIPPTITMGRIEIKLHTTFIKYKGCLSSSIHIKYSSFSKAQLHASQDLVK